MAIAPSNYKYEIQEYNINLGQSEQQFNQNSESKAIYYHSQGDFNKALEIIETINNPNYDLLLIKADSYLKIGRHEKALELYKKLVL
jgi:tetratricopeptide (TPR) repeat protein